MTREALPGPEKQPDDIPMLRGNIDALDEVIIRLVAERAHLSRRVQAARIATGGSRVELGRERQIRDSYRTLGPDGPSLADAILTVSRGRLAAPPPVLATPSVPQPPGAIETAGAGESLPTPPAPAIPRMAVPQPTVRRF